jgi:PAS domain S-box-containing protein
VEDLRSLLDAIVESSDDAIISKNLDGTITSWNAAATRIFGYSSEEIVGQSILKLIPPELQHEEAEILNRLRSGERIEHYETVRVAKSGARINISLTISPIKNGEGRVIGASKVARDISDRLRSDELRSRLAAIVESSEDAIVSKDLNGIIKSWNTGAFRLFGWKAEEIIGRSVLTLIPEELKQEEAEILRKLRAGERIDHYETQRLHKNGRLIEVSLTVSPIRDSSGRVVGASKIARDITERKRIQDALIESEKLAATGRMAATIAHEINNPLEAMTNLAYLLTTDDSLSETARRFANMLLEEIVRASGIAKQTLSFYRETSIPASFDVRDVLDSVLSLNQRSFERKNVKIRREYSKVEDVFGFRSELRQVFANLVLNALDALSEGGEICVRVSNDPSSNGTGKRIRVSIQDNGNGIPASARQNLFRPFFTTKTRGNGLGLWVSRGIVQKHSGKIKVRTVTKPGHSGAVFTVLLPINGLPLTRPNEDRILNRQP